MIAMCFDLSSTCIGVTFAQLKSGRIRYAQTLAVIPEHPSGKNLGYTTQKPKEIHYNGNKFKGFLRPKELYISKEEADRRLRHFKNYAHREMLRDIGKQCGRFLEKIQPDVIAIEKNKSFNGILTTKLLAEIAGGLYFYTGARNIPMFDYDEATIRAKIRKDITEFNRYKEGTNLVAADTKWEIYCRLRSYFETNYPGLIDFSKMTMDESDSLAVFYHLLTTELQPQN